MKHILKLFILSIVICLYHVFTYWDNCDAIRQQAETKLQERNQCYNTCVSNKNPCDHECQIDCDENICGEINMAYQNLVNQHNACLGSTWVDGPTFQGEWNWEESFSVHVSFNKHAPGYMWNLNQTIHCNKISVEWWQASISNQGLDGCNVSIFNITQNSVIINVPSGVCYLWSFSNNAWTQAYARPWSGSNGWSSPCCPEWYSESDGSCCNDSECTSLPSNCDKIKQMVAACPTIPAESINSESVEYIKINEGQCCFNGWTRLPKCECDNPPVNNTCESGYVLDWACCVTCENPPQNGQCESWYKLEDVCCVEMSCEELNSWDKEKCDERREKWEAVIWENCSCACDPARWCCGVQLNVPLPFIGDCIELTNSNSTAGARDGSISINQLNAFPVLIKWISKIIVTLIMIFSVIVVIFAWVMMTTSVANESNYKTWLEMLKKVIIALILLWTSWLILKLINPTFFWG